jgi:carbonic anhydrase
MNRRNALKLIAGLALCPACAPSGFAAEWSYEGAHGPDHWGDVDAASKVCGVGNQQSPIDIAGSVRASLPRLGFAWKKSADTIVNNGHTIQLDIADGSALKIGNDTYKLVQFHFHRPSEHTIAGKSFPMEVHFVHQAPSGALGVIGVLMTAGRTNPAFARIVATMPQSTGPAVKADARIDPNALLPAGHSYYGYAGSLTTPPCSEVVSWMLLTSPVTVAAADIEAFAKLYPMNARPVQKVSRRYVLRSQVVPSPRAAAGAGAPPAQ